jgi:ribosomal protein S14
LLTRQTVRDTAGRVLRSDDLIADEKEVATQILRDSPELGNPHAVRCGWCGETRTLFRDENDGPFMLTRHGWRCDPCNVAANSQEIKF